MLEARWQQILKALDEMKEKELDGLFARREKPLPVEPVEIEDLNTMAEAPLPVASEPLPVPRKADPTDLPLPAEERVAQQMLTRVEQLLAKHPKLSPFAGPLAATAMEKAAGRSEQPDTAKAFTALQNGFRNRLDQWFLPAEPPTTSGPLTTA
jgi:hypothetical protein